jgi:ABC-type multidrug transport system fused ATPase/permease subunit
MRSAKWPIAGSTIKILADSLITYKSMQILPRYFLESLLVLFVVVFTLLSLVVTKNISMALPVLSIFVAASGRLLPTFTGLIANTSQMRFGRYSLQQVYDDLLYFEKNKNLANNLPIETSKSNVLDVSEIRIKEVSYRYPNTKFPAISNVSMNIKLNDSIGIIGSSGAGKSTLVNLLLGLLEPDSGAIYVNDLPINKQLRPWLNNCAYIPQTIYLLDDTLPLLVPILRGQGEAVLSTLPKKC